MAKTWARLVENGAKTFENVPAKFKSAVKEILIADGYWNEQ